MSTRIKIGEDGKISPADVFKVRSEADPAGPKVIPLKVVPVFTPPVPEYHQSQINMFLKCGLQYEFRYIQGIIVPPQAALTVGGAVDVGVTRNLVQKVKSRKDLPVSDVLDAFSTEFDARAPETDWEGEDRGEQKDLGARLVKAHHEYLAPKIQPATVQEKFVIETDAGYNLGGTIDLREESGIVADTKTSGKRYTEDAITGAIQPAIYDFAAEALDGKKPPAFRYDVLLKTKTGGVQQVQAPVTQNDREHLFRAVDGMHRALKAGVFLPAAENTWVCSKQYCGYWHMCKGAKK